MRSFFDTNVLVYMFDADAPEKQQKARDLYSAGVTGGSLPLSTQVLQEFYITVTRKLRDPLPDDEAEAVVRDLATHPVVQVDSTMILAAIARGRGLSISFWDALIVETALTSGAERLYTEDLQTGMEIDGLTIDNPFTQATEGPESAG